MHGIKDSESTSGLKLTTGDPTLIGRTGNRPVWWRGLASAAAVILIGLAMSIVYSVDRSGSGSVPPELVAAEVLETEMDSLWDDLGDLEETVLVGAYYTPLSESVAYYALTEMGDAMDELEADLISF